MGVVCFFGNPTGGELSHGTLLRRGWMLKRGQVRGLLLLLLLLLVVVVVVVTIVGL